LRLFLALRLLTAGLGKFKSADNTYSFDNYYEKVVPWIINSFAESTNLWSFLVSPYAYAIAYVEIILGALLLAGIKTKYMLALVGLTLVSLAFGQMLLKGSSLNEIGILLIMNAAGLYFVRHNKLEILR
jgi:uncharacterized membrane protein YphA (DoxX/SURF4 family)